MWISTTDIEQIEPLLKPNTLANFIVDDEVKKHKGEKYYYGYFVAPTIHNERGIKDLLTTTWSEMSKKEVGTNKRGVIAKAYNMWKEEMSGTDDSTEDHLDLGKLTNVCKTLQRRIAESKSTMTEKRAVRLLEGLRDHPILHRPFQFWKHRFINYMTEKYKSLVNISENGLREWFSTYIHEHNCQLEQLKNTSVEKDLFGPNPYAVSERPQYVSSKYLEYYLCKELAIRNAIATSMTTMYAEYKENDYHENRYKFIIHMVVLAYLDQNNTYLSESEFINTTDVFIRDYGSKFELSPTDFRRIRDQYMTSGFVRTSVPLTMDTETDPRTKVATVLTPRHCYKTEMELSHMIQVRLRYPPKRRSVKIDHGLNESQRKAFWNIIRFPLSCIQGAAGTGKSHTIGTFARQNPCLFLCAWNKACQRLKKLNPYASVRTIASFLKGMADMPHASIHEQYVIIDEAGVVSNSELLRILKNIPRSTHICLVGDVFQFLPIGVTTGHPFQQLVDHNVNVTVLTTPCRSSDTNGTTTILPFGHSIINRQLYEPAYDNKTFKVSRILKDGRSGMCSAESHESSDGQFRQLSGETCGAKPTHKSSHTSCKNAKDMVKGEESRRSTGQISKVHLRTGSNEMQNERSNATSRKRSYEQIDDDSIEMTDSEPNSSLHMCDLYCTRQCCETLPWDKFFRDFDPKTSTCVALKNQVVDDLNAYLHHRHHASLGKHTKHIPTEQGRNCSRRIGKNKCSALCYCVGSRVVALRTIWENNSSPIQVHTESNLFKAATNGEMGTIQEVVFPYKKECPKFTIKFDNGRKGKNLTFDVDFAGGYSLTVHKSQGSEWKTCYVVLDGGEFENARLLYVASTRAKSATHIGELSSGTVYKKGTFVNRAIRRPHKKVRTLVLTQYMQTSQIAP